MLWFCFSDPITILQSILRLWHQTNNYSIKKEKDKVTENTREFFTFTIQKISSCKVVLLPMNYSSSQPSSHVKNRERATFRFIQNISISFQYVSNIDPSIHVGLG